MDNLLALTTGMVLAGDYRIEAVLGAGGFGITYLARETTLDRQVAIKEYFPSDFATRGGTTLVRAKSKSVDEDYAWGLERFIEEAQTLARFDHPHITRVFRYFRENNTGYMVLQFEEGRSFKAWLDQLQRPPHQDELDRIIAPLLDALELIHDSDFLHRDIAPDNIIIRPDGTPVLIDFGSARGEIAEHSKTVSALVKPGYSPFEQYAITGKRQGPWTDIYALGATLYHAVTGSRPFDAPTRITADDLELAEVAARAPYRPDFLAAIDMALALRIEDRPQTVRAWRAQLLGQPPRRPAAAAGNYPAAAAGNYMDKGGNAVPGRREAQAGRPPAQAGAQTRKIDDEALPPPVWRARRPEAPAANPKANAQSDRQAHLGKAARPIAQVGAQAGERTPGDPLIPPKRGPRRSLIDLLAEAKAEMAVLLPTIKRRAGAAAAAIGDAARARMPELGESAPAPVTGSTPVPGSAASQARPQPTTELLRPTPAAAKARTPKPPVTALVQTPSPAPANQPADKPTPPPAKTPPAAKHPAPKPVSEPAPAARKVKQTDARPAASSGKPSSGKPSAGKPSEGKPNIRAQKVRPPRQPSTWSLPRLVIKLGLIVGLVSAIVYFQHGWPDQQVRTAEVAQSAPDFALVRSLRGHDMAVAAIAVSSDGKRIVSAAGNFINIWDFQSGEVLRVLSEQSGEINSLDAADKRVLTGLNDGTLTLWNSDTGERVESFKRHEGPVWSVAFTGNSERFFSGSQDSRVRVWGTRGTRRSMTGHENAVLSVAHAKDKSYLVSGGVDGTVRLWRDLRRPKLVRVYKGHSDDVRAVAIDHNGRMIASASYDMTVKLWSADRDGLIATLEGHGNRVVAVAFSPDGALLASGSEDGTVKLWNVATHALIHTYVGHVAPVRTVAFSADGQHLISGGDDKTVRIWNARAGSSG